MSIISGTFASRPQTVTKEYYLYLQPGEEFTLDLDSNPSTGYEWIASSIDTEFLNLKSSIYQPPNSPDVGAPGIQRFTFKTIKTGITTLKMQYQRPWETEPYLKKIYHVYIGLC